MAINVVEDVVERRALDVVDAAAVQQEDRTRLKTSTARTARRRWQPGIIHQRDQQESGGTRRADMYAGEAARRLSIAEHSERRPPPAALDDREA